MTVIACRDGVMAADTAVWCGNIIVGHRQKVMRLVDGRLVACTGSSPVIAACKAWLDGKSEKPAPEAEDAFGGLILSQSGIQRISYKFHLYENAGEFACEGAHGEFMFGAMLMGASAAEAVRLAIEHGDNAGGDVQIEKLGGNGWIREGQ
jgi:hypothetical protein